GSRARAHRHRSIGRDAREAAGDRGAARTGARKVLRRQAARRLARGGALEVEGVQRLRRRRPRQLVVAAPQQRRTRVVGRVRSHRVHLQARSAAWRAGPSSFPGCLSRTTRAPRRMSPVSSHVEEAPPADAVEGTAPAMSRGGTVIAAVRSALAYGLLIVYVAVTAPPGLLLAWLFRWKGILYDLGHIGASMALGLAGIRVVVTGREHVPRDRAVVFCANHQSNVDPPVLFRVLHRRLHVLYKAELTKIPLLGWAFLLGGFVPVERHNREAAMAAIERAAESFRAGNSFLIFPEGTRSRTRQLLPF